MGERRLELTPRVEVPMPRGQGRYRVGQGLMTLAGEPCSCRRQNAVGVVIANHTAYDYCWRLEEVSASREQ